MKRIFSLWIFLSISSHMLSHSSFENILLVVYYNFPFYESITLLKEYYQPYFKHIVFYGPQEHPHVHCFDGKDGYLSYGAVADAMKRYPSFDGYLFVMDDCLLNTWRFEHFDTKKIWFSYLKFMLNANFADIRKGYDNEFSTWSWWRSQWGCEPTIKAYAALPEPYKKMLVDNVGPHVVVAGYSDVAYIPACYRKQYIELAELFGKQQSFLEVALPTILSCLSPYKNWQWLYGYGTDRSCQAQDYRDCVDFNHPIKLSMPETQILVKNLIKDQYENTIKKDVQVCYFQNSIFF